MRNSHWSHGGRLPFLASELPSPRPMNGAALEELVAAWHWPSVWLKLYLSLSRPIQKLSLDSWNFWNSQIYQTWADQSLILGWPLGDLSKQRYFFGSPPKSGLSLEGRLLKHVETIQRTHDGWFFKISGCEAAYQKASAKLQSECLPVLCNWIEFGVRRPKGQGIWNCKFRLTRDWACSCQRLM